MYVMLTVLKLIVVDVACNVLSGSNVVKCIQTRCFF